MTRTLITGVAGFTGRYLAPLLAKLGHEVHGITHDSEVQTVEGVHSIYDADLADFTAVCGIVRAINPQHVVHLAGIAFVAHSDIEQIYRSNVVGTRQLLEALALLPQTPVSILLASSANVYGNAREGVLDESLSYAPVNDYGISKVAMEYVASLYRARLPLVVVRPFNYTGRGQSDQFVIPKIVAHAINGARVIELGNLDVARDFSDVRTIVQIYARLLANREAIGRTFNICSWHAVALREVLGMVSRLKHHEFDVRVSPALLRTNEVRSLCGSPAHLESVIGKIPRIPLEETLSWMLGA